ncbi:hypothetical protein CBS101457_003342 [Exobasidium rhododendri]|nr:hypothetical protein CBS101457_003342 [Exobasidium rhododendri]
MTGSVAPHPKDLNQRQSNDIRRSSQHQHKGHMMYTQSSESLSTSCKTEDDDYPRDTIPSPYEETQGLNYSRHPSPYNSKGEKEEGEEEAEEESEEEDGRGSSARHQRYGGAGTFANTERPRRTLKAVLSGDRPASSPQKQGISSPPSATRQIGASLVSLGFLRQLVYIASVGFLLWIPGLIALIVYNASASNDYDRPQFLMTGLFWWSIWLSVIWVGIWISNLVATFLPIAIRKALGVVAVAFKTPLDYAVATRNYVAFFFWSILVYVTFLSTVWSHFPGHNAIDSSLVDPLAASNSSTNSTSPSSASSTSSLLFAFTAEASTFPTSTVMQNSDAAWMVSFSRFFFGLMICSAVLLAEKVVIQSVATSFHRVTYSDRINESNFHMSILTNLLSHAPPKGKSLGQDTTLTAEHSQDDQPRKAPSYVASSIFARAQKYKIQRHNGESSGPLKIADLTFGTALSSPFSPQSVVEASLESTSQAQMLARRLFYAFATSKDVKTGQRVFEEADIAKYYKSKEEAHLAFLVFDGDNGGSITLEEMEQALLGMHQERMCLLASLHDVDSAVLKLDHIFMSLYLAISCVIIAALLSTKFSTLVASLGTILLGLSWLVGSTAQESLASIVWVFCKHPIDVGDAIEVPALLAITNGTRDAIFYVEEILLLSTVLKTTTGKYVQVSNSQLAQMPVVNVRRSGPIFENFTVSVSYDTTFEQIEDLRKDMMFWLQSQGKDYLPGLDVRIDSLGDQSNLNLTLDIRFKSNWQNDHLRAKRRNKWIVRLKELMSQSKIFGPGHASETALERDTREEKSTRASSYVLMDECDQQELRRFEGQSQTSAEEKEHSRRDMQPLPPLERSKLNDVVASSPPRHGTPSTRITALNVRGRRGEDERIGDIEMGSRPAY